MGDNNSNNELKNLPTKTYNNSEFIIEIFILELSSGIRQKFAKDEILRIQIDHDINSYYDRGSITIKDFSNFYTLLANNVGNWSITFNIIQTESYDLVPEATFKKEYNIISVNVEEITYTHATVRLNFADPIEQIFSRNSVYSSQNDSDATSVLSGILQSVGFRKDAEGIVGIPKMDSSGITMNYITDNNNSALMHIDFILSQIYNNEKGFPFLYFHPTQHKLQFYWSKDVLNNNVDLSDDSTKYKNAAYCLKIASEADSERNKENVAEIKSYSNVIDYNDAARIIYPTYIQGFNVKTSRMETSDSGVWSFDKFKTLFSQNESMTTELPKSVEEPSSVFVELIGFYSTAPKDAVGKFYRHTNIDEFRQRLRAYFIYKNMISFKVLGKIWREPGQVFEILYDQSPNTDKMSGKWMCVRIIDDFESQNYYQHIFLTRISDKVDYNAVADFTDELAMTVDKNN